ncbi:radical SAM additional 4Fe4S-binding domain-containing protein [Candidatus Magnetomorum sp. HK-1]|nr:radical SAM additional 4Fe4S-binding domain-containing protein [Candidatus Magnetomorum sp. HK-1]
MKFNQIYSKIDDAFKNNLLMRETIKNHPTLSIGDIKLTFDVNNHELIIYNTDMISYVNTHLEEAPKFDWPYNIKDKVSYLNFTITNRCNANCSYCFAGDSPKKDMSPDTAKNISENLEQIIDLNADYYPGIFFFGGEPTLNMGAIKSVMDVVNKHKWEIIPKIKTNGLFDEKLIDYFEKEFFIMQFSYDGEKANHLRFSNNLTNKLINNIKLCRQIGLPIIFRPTLSYFNSPYLEEFIDELIFLGGKNIISINFGILNRNKGYGKELEKNIDPDTKTFKYNYYKLIEKSYNAGIKINNMHITNLYRKTNKSDLPAYISIDGKISVGCIYGDSIDERQMTYGLFRNNRFEIDKDRLEEMKNNFLSNKFLHYSQNCFCRSTCRGAKKYIKTFKRIYDKNHMDIPDENGYCFQEDIECNIHRSMLEAYIIFILKETYLKNNDDIKELKEGVYSLYASSIVNELYRPKTKTKKGI